jgi:hypothetical protein
MPARTWTAVMTQQDLDRTRKVEGAFNPEYSIDAVRYGDPLAFDRAAIADFIAAVPSGKAGALVDLYETRAPAIAALPGTVGASRRHLLDVWVRQSRGEKVTLDLLSGGAGAYLRDRDYPMRRILDLAAPLADVLAETVVRDGAILPEPPATPDTLTLVLASLTAGLTTAEIAGHIDNGDFPDITALDLLIALA